MQLALPPGRRSKTTCATSRGIIIPIGSTEQHGPNGLIGTDHLDAEFVSKGVGDSDRVPGGADADHRHVAAPPGFTGSVTLRPSTLIAVVTTLCTR